MAGLDRCCVKVSVRGTMAGGVQDVSWGFWLGVGNVDFISQSDLDGITADVKTAVDAFLQTSTVAKWWTSQEVFTGVQCYAYFASSVTADLQAEALFAAGRAGSGTANHPKETSIVVSLRSGTPGRSGRGRFYLPATGIAMDATGVVSSDTDVDNLGNAADTMFTTLGTATWELVVASFTKGRVYPVTSLVTDNRPDTQRRRTDKISATHTKVNTF